MPFAMLGNVDRCSLADDGVLWHLDVLSTRKRACPARKQVFRERFRFIVRNRCEETGAPNDMSRILSEMRKSRLLWLLVFVPVVLAAERLSPERHTLLFLLSIFAIVPLAALLSRATKSVAERTRGCSRRSPQRHPWKSHRACYRADGPSGRAVSFG